MGVGAWESEPAHHQPAPSRAQVIYTHTTFKAGLPEHGCYDRPMVGTLRPIEVRARPWAPGLRPAGAGAGGGIIYSLWVWGNYPNGTPCRGCNGLTYLAHLDTPPTHSRAPPPPPPPWAQLQRFKRTLPMEYMVAIRQGEGGEVGLRAERCAAGAKKRYQLTVP